MEQLPNVSRINPGDLREQSTSARGSIRSLEKLRGVGQSSGVTRKTRNDLAPGLARRLLVQIVFLERCQLFQVF